MFADMVAQMIAKWATMQLVKGLGSIFGGMAGGGAASASSSGPNVDAIAMYMNANGNVLKGGFQAFANGGIVKGPTLGLVGEGRFNEAVVPLPDGRKIPVEMGKNMGGDVNSSVVVNISNEGSESRTKGDQGNQLAKGIEGAVKQVIMREMRPGGMIASRQ
jgi:phage-related minor tail protein